MTGSTLTRKPEPAEETDGPTEGRKSSGQRSLSAPRRKALVESIAYSIGSLLIVVAALTLWQVAADRGWINGMRYGSPAATWERLTFYYGEGPGWTQTLATAKAVGIALCIGLPAGILSGLFLAAVPPVDRLLGVFLVPLNSMPRIALVPLFILWFGLTVTTKVAVAVSIIYFISLFNARAGVKGIEADVLIAGRQLGLSRRQIAQKIILPGSIPTIFAGVRLSVAYAILGVVASEMIAARDGLGLDVVRYSQNLQIDGVWSIILVLAVSATTLNALLELFERWLLRWQ